MGDVVGWLKLSANYGDDPAVLELGNDLAELLFLRGLALAKRCESGGFIDRRQLRLILPSGCDPDLARTLVEVDLWHEDESGWWVRSWDKWQQGSLNAAARAARQRAAALTNHGRWHLDRGRVDPACPLCCPVDESLSSVTDPTDGGPTHDRQMTDSRAGAESEEKTAGHDRSRSVPSVTDEREKIRETRHLSAPSPSANGLEDRGALAVAIFQACAWDQARLTRSGKRSLSRAERELDEVGTTPDLVRQFAEWWRSKYPDATLTPYAITKHWGAFLGDHTDRRVSTQRMPDLAGATKWGATRAALFSTADEAKGSAVSEGFDADEVRAAVDGWRKCQGVSEQGAVAVGAEGADGSGPWSPL